MKEYRIAKGWAIFIYISAPLLIVLFSSLLVLLFTETSGNNLKFFWILAPISLAMIAAMVVGILDTVNGKFIIDTDRLSSIKTSSNRELLFTEIKGYRISDKYILIEPNNGKKKKIKIGTFFARRDEIIAWLSNHYPDLDVAKAIEEKEEILHNEEFGLTAEQREERLIKAHKVATALNWSGGLIAAWTLFFPNPYEYAIIASIVFPIFCIIALKYFDGLIRIEERKGTAYPTIFWAIFATSIGLGLRALLDFHIFDHSRVWTPAIIVSLLYIAVLTIGNKEFKFKKAKDYLIITGISIFIFGYGYGAVITLNCLYDKSEPEIFNSTILNKRISSGKSTTYYLELSSWGQQNKSDEVSVPKDLYRRVGKNDEVKIYFMKGRFKIPWFEVIK